jgi:DinB superfamily
MEQLKYPVGKFIFPESIDSVSLQSHVKTICDFPQNLKELVSTMTEEELNMVYRPEGWTARQVIHHVADSHSHALIRFKWSLTEDNPTIKPYLEAKYAQLADYNLPIDSAVSILQGVHAKWQSIMHNMTADDWSKGYFHPETQRFFRLDTAAALYAWHCNHHLAHIKLCKQ